MFLSRFFSKKPAPVVEPVPGYHVFTKEFDEIISGSDLAKLLQHSTDGAALAFEAAVEEFNQWLEREGGEIRTWASPLAGKLVANYPLSEREGIIVTFLIDHSGSMRGQNMMSALVAVNHASSLLGQVGIQTEILGFTTRSWKGGASRAKWIASGKPSRPGRLCDLRHIIYKSAGQPAAACESLEYALHLDVLKENIDGEALEWAASRLTSEQGSRRAICIVSDGAPVDDSTLVSNQNPRFLIDHLLETENKVRQQGIELGHLLLEQANYREFELFEVGYSPEVASKGLIKLIARMFFPKELEQLTER